MPPCLQTASFSKGLPAAIDSPGTANIIELFCSIQFLGQELLINHIKACLVSNAAKLAR